MPEVSIVIISMNNLGNLYPCLDSIKEHTKISYETFVVAFLFSKENLQRLKTDYPWVKIVESNELRGFSENNNLALRQTNGKFCFVVNDDTYMNHPCIDTLVESFSYCPENVAVVSPLVLNKDGSVQRNGKCKYNHFTYLLQVLKLKELYNKHSRYTNQQGLYQTYNLSGACFLIRTDVFKSMGWFDERYYFCPEDIALSTKINKAGMMCYVNTDAVITHTQGGTWSKIQKITLPTAEKGNKIFYCDDSKWFLPIYYTLVYIHQMFATMMHFILYKYNHKEEHLVKYEAHFNVIKTIGSNEMPKQLFIRLYTSLKHGK